MRIFGKRKVRRRYLDYTASTPVLPEVVFSMKPYWNTCYGNPSGIHREGVEARKAVETARSSIAQGFGVHNDEIIFTASGTESNNLAIFGVVKALERKGRALPDMHFVTSSIEHPSVLDCFKVLESKGAHISYVGVDEEGVIDPKSVRDVLTEQTVLVSIMYVNNEIGTIQPIKEIAKIIRTFKKEKGIESSQLYFHTDASQAMQYLSVDIKKLGVHLLTVDGQKIYGPKGVGVLFKARHVNLSPILIGGSQEFGMRPGTENVPLIVGFAKAFECTLRDKKSESERLQQLRDYFFELVVQHILNVQINGSRNIRISNNVNISIPGIESEFMVVALDTKGIACGSRSACIGHDGAGSYVIEALGKDDSVATSSLRFSLGRYTTKKDIIVTVRALKEIVSYFDNTNKL